MKWNDTVVKQDEWFTQHHWNTRMSYEQHNITSTNKHNILQFLLLLFRVMETAIHPQQHGEEDKRHIQHLGNRLPPPLLNEKVYRNPREDASERRNQSVHRNDETGVLRIHALNGNQLAERKRNVQEEAEEERHRQKTHFRGNSRQIPHEESRNNRRDLTQQRARKVEGIGNPAAPQRSQNAPNFDTADGGGAQST